MLRLIKLQKEYSPQLLRKSSDATSINKRTLCDIIVESVSKIVVKEWLANREYSQLIENEIKRITERHAALTLQIEQATLARNEANATLKSTDENLNDLQQQMKQCELSTLAIMQDANNNVSENTEILKQTGIRFFAISEQINLNHHAHVKALDSKLDNICEMADAKKELAALQENFARINKVKLAKEAVDVKQRESDALVISMGPLNKNTDLTKLNALKDELFVLQEKYKKVKLEFKKEREHLVTQCKVTHPSMLSLEDLSKFNIEEHPDPEVAITMKSLMNEIKVLIENLEPNEYRRLTLPINLPDALNLWFLLCDYENTHKIMLKLITEFHDYLAAHVMTPSEWRIQSFSIRNLVNEISEDIIGQLVKNMETAFENSQDKSPLDADDLDQLVTYLKTDKLLKSDESVQRLLKSLEAAANRNRPGW